MNAAMAAPGASVEGLARQVVDPCHHGQVVGHELVEVDVDGLVCRQDVVLLGAAAQHALEPVGPVVAHALDVDPVAGEAGRVGEHRHHRRGDRDRVAVGDDEGGVGERVDQRRELLEVLGRLEHPAGAAPQPLQHLEDPAEVGVARAAGRGPGRRRARVGMGAVVSNSMVEKSMARSWISSWVCSTVISCMRLKYGRAASRNESAIAVRSRRGSGAPAAGPLALGQDRLEALPVGERAQGGVGRHQVVQVGGAGPGQPADDDRGDDLLVEDLGVPPRSGPRSAAGSSAGRG